TNSTVCSLVTVSDADVSGGLPESYWCKGAVIKRCLDLEREVKALHPSAEELDGFHDKFLSDYVYHSNRIEGSLLDRGQTLSILRGIDETALRKADFLEKKISSFSYIDQ